MRFLQIASFYTSYLNVFYARDPARGTAPFAAQIDALLADGFGGGHLIAPYMRGVGFDPTLIITNALPAQMRWALDHGLPVPKNPQELNDLVLRQIEIINPDVLYVLDPITFDARVLAGLRVRPKLVMGWRAANIPAGTSWAGFHLMLSSDEGCRRRALELGAAAAAAFRPGFPKALAERVADTPRSADIVFCGQMTTLHKQRIAAMTDYLTAVSAKREVSTALHLGLQKDAVFPPLLRQHDKGAVWGLDMYRAVRSGRVAPNFHIDLVVTKENMRLIETTGVGSLMLTEADAHMETSFAPGREIETYKNPGELVEKTLYYLDHPAECEAIAKRGQERCFADHAMERRAETLAGLVAAHLHMAASKPRPAVPAPDDLSRALSLLAAGQIDDAAAIISALVQRAPTNGAAVYVLGRIAWHLGSPDKAVELFQAAMTLDLAPSVASACVTDLTAATRKAAPPPLSTLSSLQFHQESATPAQPPMPTNTIDLAMTFPGVSFGTDVQCLGVDSTRIGKGSAVGDGSWLNVCIRDRTPRMVIGECVLVGRRAVLSSGTYLEIGAHTIFGPNVYVSSASHEYEGNHAKPIMMCGIRDQGRLVVEENCWLGMNAVVDGGITVGRGSVVGANSVLRRSIPPFSVAVGAPARIVRMLNPETLVWEAVASDADIARIEAARTRKPFPDRAAYKAQLDTANGGRALDPLVAGRGLHLA